MNSIQDLENSIDIVELVKKYTNLKKSWTNYKSLCPFPWHNEKTPSFIVSPTKQIGYCFWCHRWWWPIKFIMDIENCSFKEAIDILSNITWIKIKWIDKEKEKLKKNIYSILKEIKNYYINSLKKEPKVLKYLYDRWLKQESIEKFELWFSDSWINLYNYLKEKWFDDDLIKESNVFLDLEKRKDKFLWRIIFPIKNIRWDTVAFAWRIINLWEPKYLNSPTSKIYDKSNILYWLYERKNEISKQDFIIITEWYMDTISLHQAWFKNTVCVSWTALTEKHIQIIKRITKKIYLCFDNDKAWENATNLAIEIIKNKDLELKIIILDWWKDPDEIIKKWIDFNNLIKNSLSPISYFIKKLWPIEWINDKKEALKKMLEIVKSYHDNVERDYFLKEISQKLNIKLDLVYLEFNKIKIKSNNQNDIILKKEEKNIEDNIIALFIKYPNLSDFIIENLIDANSYFSPLLQKIIKNKKVNIDELEINKRNKYLALTSMNEALQMQAQIENHTIKTNEKILEDIKKQINKFNKDMIKNIEKTLKEKIISWNIEAIKEYQKFLKIKK